MNCWWLQRFFYQLEAKKNPKTFLKTPKYVRTRPWSEASLKSCRRLRVIQIFPSLLEEILQIKRSNINWADWRLYKLTLSPPTPPRGCWTVWQAGVTMRSQQLKMQTRYYYINTAHHNKHARARPLVKSAGVLSMVISLFGLLFKEPLLHNKHKRW